MPPAPCVHWLRRSTPVLVGSLLCEGRGGLNRLCAAFVLALSSSAGGVSAFLLYAQRFLDWEEGKIGLFVALFAVVTGTMILFNTIALPRLLACCCALLRGRAFLSSFFLQGSCLHCCCLCD